MPPATSSTAPADGDTPEPARPRYLPIGDYAVIGDGRSIALVSRSGSIDWWCVPRFDSDAVFARILDADLGGTFEIRPAGPFRARRRYLHRTNILETEFTAAGGVVRVVDFMPALTEAQKRTYPVAFREIVRRVRCIEGSVVLDVRIEARPQFGRRTPLVRRQRATRYVIEWVSRALHLVSNALLDKADGTLVGRFSLDAGEQLDFALSYSPEAPADLPVLGNLDLIQRLTEEFWIDWADACRSVAVYGDAVLRSALALKLLTYAPSGAIIAAPTSSLPEHVGGVRNWDYRFCWLRDAAFTIRAMLRLGYHLEAHAFAHWLLYTTRVSQPALKPLYTIYGGTRIPERSLDYLDGYRGSRPVRVGNAADRQFQLDVYGEVIDALTLYRRSGGEFDKDARRLLRGLARIIMAHWPEPDDGIWEVRSGRAQHIHSKVMGWVGLERALELARAGDLQLQLEPLTRTRDAIRSWILENGYSPALGAFTRTPGRDLDAALLVIPLVGFLPPDDPRVASTVEAIRQRLARAELVYRYLGPDGLPGGEGAFVICSFWLVEALAHLGRLDEAHESFTRLLERRNDLGLLAEQIDPETGQQLGNFPQAFSHIGLINAALTLAEHDAQR